MFKFIIQIVIYLFIFSTISFAANKENILFLYTKDYNNAYYVQNLIHGIIDYLPKHKYNFRTLNICYPNNCYNLTDDKDLKKLQWVYKLNSKYIISLFDSTYQILLQHPMYSYFETSDTILIIFGLMREAEQYLYPIKNQLLKINIFIEKPIKDEISNIIFKHTNMLWLSNYCRNNEIDKYFNPKQNIHHFFIQWNALRLIDEYSFYKRGNINIYVLYNNQDYMSVRILNMILLKYKTSRYNDLYSIKPINVRSVNSLFKILKNRISRNSDDIIYNTIDSLKYKLYNINIDGSEICTLIYKFGVKQQVTTINILDINRYNMFKTVVIDWYNMGKSLARFLNKKQDKKCQIYNIRHDIWN